MVILLSLITFSQSDFFLTIVWQYDIFFYKANDIFYSSCCVRVTIDQQNTFKAFQALSLLTRTAALSRAQIYVNKLPLSPLSDVP